MNVLPLNSSSGHIYSHPLIKIPWHCIVCPHRTPRAVFVCLLAEDKLLRCLKTPQLWLAWYPSSVQGPDFPALLSWLSWVNTGSSLILWEPMTKFLGGWEVVQQLWPDVSHLTQNYSMFLSPFKSLISGLQWPLICPQELSEIWSVTNGKHYFVIEGLGG